MYVYDSLQVFASDIWISSFDTKLCKIWIFYIWYSQ